MYTQEQEIKYFIREKFNLFPIQSIRINEFVDLNEDISCVQNYDGENPIVSLLEKCKLFKIFDGSKEFYELYCFECNQAQVKFTLEKELALKP